MTIPCSISVLQGSASGSGTVSNLSLSLSLSLLLSLSLSLSLTSELLDDPRLAEIHESLFCRRIDLYPLLCLYFSNLPLEGIIDSFPTLLRMKVCSISHQAICNHSRYPIKLSSFGFSAIKFVAIVFHRVTFPFIKLAVGEPASGLEIMSLGLYFSFISLRR